MSENIQPERNHPENCQNCLTLKRFGIIAEDQICQSYAIKINEALHSALEPIVKEFFGAHLRTFGAMEKPTPESFEAIKVFERCMVPAAIAVAVKYGETMSLTQFMQYVCAHLEQAQVYLTRQIDQQ